MSINDKSLAVYCRDNEGVKQYMFRPFLIDRVSVDGIVGNVSPPGARASVRVGLYTLDDENSNMQGREVHVFVSVDGIESVADFMVTEQHLGDYRVWRQIGVKLVPADKEFILECVEWYFNQDDGPTIQ